MIDRKEGQLGAMKYLAKISPSIYKLRKVIEGDRVRNVLMVKNYDIIDHVWNWKIDCEVED